MFKTNCGSFTVKLDQKTAPETTASLVQLARDGFYDDTIFHRIVPGFVIQGGDPTRPAPAGRATRPSTCRRGRLLHVRHRRDGQDPGGGAGTSGSQFFVVTAPDAGLPPEYAVVGTITAGLEVVDQIGMLGDQNQDLPDGARRVRSPVMES